MTLETSMAYEPDMEQIDSTMMEEVLGYVKAYDPAAYTATDVREALQKDRKDIRDFMALLSPAADPFLETMAREAKKSTMRYFGNAVNLFTPLYIANYCDNYCVYCGFNKYQDIHRAKLSPEHIRREMEAIAATGLEEVLILTGESREFSDVSYIGEAVKIAHEYFKMVGLEIYPLNTDEYAYLNRCGADYVTVFQETYDPVRYEKLHREGFKRSFPYRFYAPERALRGGMRGVGFGALLGLGDFRQDALATGIHAYLLQQKYPHGEIAVSCPRLRPTINNDKINPKDVHERQLLQVILAYRLFLPFASITISTREQPRFRDHVVGMAATKISAGVSTGIGEHSDKTGEDKGDEQFVIADNRSVDQVIQALESHGLQAVMNDYVYLPQTDLSDR